MEAAPSAKPPPVPPNYVSLRDLQELRLKEKEEQERRRREEEEAAAAAAARREAEKAAMAAAIKREAAMKAEAKRRAASWEASGGVRERERHRAGKAQGQGNQLVAVAHRAPASTPRPVAAGKREAAIGGGRGEKGPDDAPHGGGNPWVKAKWKGKGKVKEKPAEVVPASPCGGGKPENKSESNSKAKGKDPGNQAAESSLSGGPAEAAILSSRDRSRRGRPAGAGGRSGAETCPGIAPVKTADPPPPPCGVRSDDTGKPKPPASRRAGVVAGGDSPDGKKAGPAQVPPASAADGGSKPTSGGELRKTTEAKPGGLVEGRRRQVEATQAVAAELNPRVARCSVGPLRGRGKEPVQQHGRVWVPKAAAGSSAGAGL
ncbi:unnamed protein product [Urochloa decumbens]|uniref:Uncharacterized protein n=1 Tax=Urochloa decumbens TaxID=240449 RepID=A0ABC8YJ54_9POAL